MRHTLWIKDEATAVQNIDKKDCKEKSLGYLEHIIGGWT